MDNVTIATVITEDGISRCISATTSLARGVPDLRITGVTDRAASEIKALVLAVLKKRGVRLPQRTITVDLTFDVPFEATSELGFAAIVSIAWSICLSCNF